MHAQRGASAGKRMHHSHVTAPLAPLRDMLTSPAQVAAPGVRREGQQLAGQRTRQSVGSAAEAAGQLAGA